MSTTHHLFTNDYSEGACPEVLDALIRTNAEQTPGYTEDEYCARASDLVRSHCGLTAKEADVFFTVGGTAANVISLCGLLNRPYDAVVCTPDGHINTHETGAMEASGHKVLVTTDADGFLTPEAVDRVVRVNAASANHMTRPTVLYVSNTTELGGVYSAARLQELRDYADAHAMKLFVDGARMASALTSADNDLTLPHLARLADAFTLGGTKAGLLFGEAVVVRDPQLRHDMPWLLKQHQNLLAKGRLLGVQFLAALSVGDVDEKTAADETSAADATDMSAADTNETRALDMTGALDMAGTLDMAGALGTPSEAPYFRYARQANQQAARLASGLQGLGVELRWPAQSNQIFARMDTAHATRISAELGCEVFVDEGDTQVIRFVTSWATLTQHTDDALETVAAILRS